MAQQLDLGHLHPRKSQPLILYSRGPSKLCGTSVPSHPEAQGEKGDSAPFDPAPHSLGDCPDGGLQAWLIVLGVRLSGIGICGWSPSTH